MHPRTILCLVLVSCLLLLGMAGSAAAAQSFAVAPFTMHTPEKYHYLRGGIQSMITSRLSSQTKLQPRDAPRLDDAGELSRVKAREILKELDLDYLVYGDVTMMREQSSLSLKILSREGDLVTRTSQMSLDELVPRLDSLIGELRQELVGAGSKQGESTGETVAQKEPGLDEGQQKQERGREKINTSFEQRETVRKKPAEDQLNPEFEQKKKRQRDANRWSSRELPFSARGMCVGDADGDGREEVFLLLKHSVKAFVKGENGLEHLATYQAGSRIKALTLDLTAPDSEGGRRIVVSALRDKKPRSFILSFREGDFAVVDKGIKLLLGVARIPPDYTPRLVGQKMNAPGSFQKRVHRVELASGEYGLGRALGLPGTTNIFNFAYLPQKQDHKVVVVGFSNPLRVYSSDGELEATTDKAYAGSEVRIQLKTTLPGMGEAHDESPRYYFLPSRLIPCNLDADGEFELLVNRVDSSYSRFLSNQRSYSSGEIHSLYWDGRSLRTAWKTRKIKGSVQDYGLGDIDNNGALDLLICINTKSGTLSWEGDKTVLLAYPLDLPENSREAIFWP